MSTQRDLYIDYIRLMVIVLVVMVHTAVTYSGIGSWYYVEKPQPPLIELLPFLLFQSFSQSFFMGLLFLVGGYMAGPALAKKGPRLFLRDRFMRLGLPALFYMLIISPFIFFVLLQHGGASLGGYLRAYYLGGRFFGASGPLWFAIALLGFSAVYAGVHAFCAARGWTERPFICNAKNLAKLSLLVTVCTFLVRLVQPIDTSILNMQLCFFSQYIVLFAAGIMMAKTRQLDQLDYRFGVRCLQLALGPGLLLWGGVFVFGILPSESGFSDLKGGWHWQSLAYALWESTNGVLVSFGLLALFRHRWNQPHAVMSKLADVSFAVYVFHAPILIAVSLWLAPVRLHSWAKFLLVGSLSLAISFALACFVFNRIPLFETRRTR